MHNSERQCWAKQPKKIRIVKSSRQKNFKKEVRKNQKQLKISPGRTVAGEEKKYE